MGATLAALAGCGGGEELSEGEYNLRLEEVFVEFNTELPKATSELTPESSLEERATALADGEPVIEMAVTDLEAIDPPPEFEQLHDRLVSLLESFGEATREAREAAESGDAQGLSAYQAETARFQEELAQLSQDYQEAGLGVGSATETGTSPEGRDGSPGAGTGAEEAAP
jgi:hypothetical protein